MNNFIEEITKNDARPITEDLLLLNLTLPNLTACMYIVNYFRMCCMTLQATRWYV